MSRMRVMSLVVAAMATFALSGCKSQKTSINGDNQAPNPTYFSADDSQPLANPAPAPTPVPAESNLTAITVGNDAPQADLDPLPATPGAQGGNSYTIRAGDTLWSIARRHYGNGQRFRDIVGANPGLTARSLRIGQTIVMP
jgi:nucleoid-associated protein YgaU